MQESIESAWVAIQDTCPFRHRVHSRHWTVEPLLSLLQWYHLVNQQVPSMLLLPNFLQRKELWSELANAEIPHCNSSSFSVGRAAAADTDEAEETLGQSKSISSSISSG
mmetsp:Transcript_12778/g.23165  ORF Transcript_12778/g.23165 Transcript_12778/m.23165 type:complete len:109 (-) Transcript_12778:383-709(-)